MPQGDGVGHGQQIDICFPDIKRYPFIGVTAGWAVSQVDTKSAI